MFVLDMRPIARTDFTEHRDFLTSEEELPAEVSVTVEGPLDATTRWTDVSQETTDDN